MKYEIGDKVYVKKDLIDEHEYGTVPFIGEMRKYCGTIVTISSVEKDSYDIMEDSGAYAWTDEMLESATVYNIYVYNDVIKISCNNYNSKEYNNIDNESIIFALKDFVKSKKWRPEYGETYYTFGIGYDVITCGIWKNTNDEEIMHNKGLIFKTKEEAEKCSNAIKNCIKDFCREAKE